MINAEVILDSVNPSGERITTVLVNMPRYILAQMNTHRTFSRNAASSRAVPTDKMIQRVVDNPVIPIHWGQNQAGMQAEQELSKEKQQMLEMLWLEARDNTVATVEKMQKIGLHKQVINRLLEPWLSVQYLITATEWDNFFALRDHGDAQHEIQVVARNIKEALKNSNPQAVSYHGWHIPFIIDEEAELPLADQLKISTARCARTSYYYHDGKSSTVEQDIQLHDRLVGSEPRHSSPAEHQAIAVEDGLNTANFVGWRQYRQYLDNDIRV